MSFNFEGGIPVMLGVTFIILKLCGVIGWSWWWVLSPFWGFGLLALFVVAIASMAFFIVKWRKKRK